MKAYKLVLTCKEKFQTNISHDIRYFTEKSGAEKVNLELQKFLEQNQYEAYIAQYLSQYINLILFLEKKKIGLKLNLTN